ncbi:MAG: DSD1 family PLP-dependent enzyme [Alphaproteobacteria bacterium]|jgi:3-hydroxy-D-aspartate aldolase
MTLAKTAGFAPGPNARLVGLPGSRQELDTPALLIDLDALEANIAAMAAHCATTGQRLRPHTKTHKSVEIARRQVAAGAVGVCCATLGEAEVMGLAGISGVHLTSPVVRPNRVARLIALNLAAERLSVVVDHPDAIQAIADAAVASGKPLDVFIDLDVGSRRTGVPSAQQVVALADQVVKASGLTYAGIQGYAGGLQHVYDWDERVGKGQEVADFLAETRRQLAAAGLEPPLITGGGTGTHDLDWRQGVLTELQAGSYVFLDTDYQAVAQTGEAVGRFREGLFVQSSVVSAAQEDCVTTDGGLKAFATDCGLPELRRGAPEGAAYSFAGDEHGRITFASDERIGLGAVVECLSPHCDPTVNLYSVYHVVQGDTLVDIWPVDTRGLR